MNHDDLSFGAPEPLTTEEAAELANTMPPTLEDAYAEGRKDEREDLNWLRQEGKNEGAYEATLLVRAEVLRELLEWEAHYLQQARGGDQSGRSDARADAAREIHDHLHSSWETRDKAEP